VKETAEGRLKAAFDAAVDGIVVIDRSGGVLMFNPAAERLFGYAAGEVIGRNVKLLMPEPYRRQHDGYIRRYLATGERRIIGIGREVEARRKDGTVFPVRLAVSELLEGGEPAFVGIIHDLTESRRLGRQLLESQAELMRFSRVLEMGQMASALAHELNQPLTAIANYAQACRRLIEEEGGRERTAGILDKVSAQAHRAGQIIQRLRDFVKRGDTDRRPEDLNAVVEEACGLALVGARAGGIAVSKRFAKGLPPVVIDRVQVQQVAVNLLRNGVEALATAKRKQLAIETRPHGGGAVAVIVTDTGPGLAEEVKRNLFKPFVTTKAGGMGVGLSICRSIVEAHGGRLWADSHAGGGAVFGFTLPAAPDRLQSDGG
jgi:two-component system sensor kinase FixL